MKRSLFSLSNTKLFTSDLGELVPCGCVEVLPGDTVQHATSALVRAAPMLAPVMHPVDVRIHHWFVPLRIIWDEFEDFITGGPAGVSVPSHPTITFGGGSGAAVGSLADYLGVPTGVNNIEVSALPFRAYAEIWNENYRDQDLETLLTVSKASGNDTTTSVALKNIGWEKDYFTSARPWEQKGPAISIPLTGTAPVYGTGKALGLTDGTSDHGLMATTSNFTYAATSQYGQNVGNTTASGFAGGNKALGVVTSGVSGMATDLSGVSAVTVNALREALALQRYEENRARYGSRYVEYLRMLGVRSSDARLQRPEYLGGGRQTIQFSEVLTTGTFGSEPVGTMKGHGIAAMRSNRYRRFFEEHGLVISLMSVRPKTMYVQGLPKMFNRRTKEDYWQQELQHIGQQEVLNKEVYAAHASPDGVFGYQDRYDEYRRQESSIGGEFRTTLNFWHFGRTFASSPALNGSFVSCVPPELPFAVPSTDVLWVMAKHSIQARRSVARVGKSFIY